MSQINVMFSFQLQDSSADSSVMSDDAADHTLVELLETEVCFLLIVYLLSCDVFRSWYCLWIAEIKQHWVKRGL